MRPRTARVRTARVRTARVRTGGVRAVLATIAAAGATLVPLTVLPAAPAAAAPVRTDERAFSDIAGCISSADNVLVSVVVDESASLQTTDPDDLRVRGIGTAIDSLEQLAAQVGESTDVHVSLSTFARSFETLVGWRRLGERSGQQLRSAATAELPGRNSGNATDYRQALLGAQRQLTERQRALRDPGACKVLLWFTDGALDVDAQTGTAASQLCQVGGIADAVRRDGIAVVALALFTPGGGVTDSQREQLRAVAEGRGSGSTCGTVPVPPQHTSGIYLPADDPAALQQLFGSAGALVGGGTRVGSVTCPGPQCPGGRYPLAVDPGVAGARVLVAGRSGSPDVRVTSPSGESVDLSGGSAEVDGATVTLIEREGFATLDVAYPTYTDEPVVWEVRPGPSRLTVYWFWGAQLDLATTQARAGERNDLRLRLLDRAGDPLPPTLYRDFRVEARVGDRPVSARVTPDGEVVGSFRLGVDRLPPALPLRVSVTARSRPGDVALGPLALTDRLGVELPPVYPTLVQDELDFGVLEGTGTVSAGLEARGSPLGPTRVCLTGSEVTVPGREPGDLVTAAERCVRLGRDGSGTLDLDLAPGASADGVASGHVTLTLRPADGSAPLEVEVPVDLEMQRVVDESTRWLLVAVLVGLALLLPLLVLLLANWATATFTMTSLSRVGSAPVRITPRGLVPRDGGELITPDHFDNAGFSGRRRERRMTLGHTGVTAESRDALGLRDARGVAVGPERVLLVSGTPPYRGEAGHQAPMMLGDVDATFVLVERTGTPEEADGTLVMVVPGNVDNEGIRDRAQETSNRVPWDEVLAEAAPRERAPAAAGASGATGSTGSTGSTGGTGATSTTGTPARSTAGSGEALPAWAQDDPEATAPPPERDPFPWEDAAARRPPTSSRTSRSRGRRRRSASDSSQETTPRPTDKDGTTDPSTRTDAPDDDGLPPLPDFLKED